MSKKGKPKKKDKNEAMAKENEAEEPSVPLAEFEELQARYREAVEVNLRQRADFDNTRKRLRRSADEAGNRALAAFIRPVLVELDHLGLAIEHAAAGTSEEFVQGVTMLHENLQGIFTGAGIEQIATDGVFDPAVHEVVAELPSDEPRGTIIGIQRTGYRLGEQVIRAAQVIVAKGPEQPAPESADEAKEEEDVADADEV